MVDVVTMGDAHGSALRWFQGFCQESPRGKGLVGTGGDGNAREVWGWEGDTAAESHGQGVKKGRDAWREGERKRSGSGGRNGEGMDAHSADVGSRAWRTKGEVWGAVDAGVGWDS